MAFTLHLLRASDLFVDVGANVGVYTVLASTTGASCMAIEPVPATHASLLANLRLNDFGSRVRAFQVALGAASGTCPFTCDLDTMNHVVAANESSTATVQVPMTTLDELLRDERPTLLKIDVEGYENQVFEGATKTLENSSLLAMIVELNGSGDRYGASDSGLIRKFDQSGFRPYAYRPFQRRVEPCKLDGGRRTGNTIFLRQPDVVAERVASAASVTVFGIAI